MYHKPINKHLNSLVSELLCLCTSILQPKIYSHEMDNRGFKVLGEFFTLFKNLTISKVCKSEWGSLTTVWLMHFSCSFFASGILPGRGEGEGVFDRGLWCLSCFYMTANVSHHKVYIIASTCCYAKADQHTLSATSVIHFKRTKNKNNFKSMWKKF